MAASLLRPIGAATSPAKFARLAPGPGRPVQTAPLTWRRADPCALQTLLTQLADSLLLSGTSIPSSRLVPRTPRAVPSDAPDPPGHRPCTPNPSPSCGVRPFCALVLWHRSAREDALPRPAHRTTASQTASLAPLRRRDSRARSPRAGWLTGGFNIVNASTSLTISRVSWHQRHDSAGLSRRQRRAGWRSGGSIAPGRQGAIARGTRASRPARFTPAGGSRIVSPGARPSRRRPSASTPRASSFVPLKLSSRATCSRSSPFCRCSASSPSSSPTSTTTGTTRSSAP